LNYNKPGFLAVDVARGSVYLMTNTFVSNFIGLIGLAFIVRFISPTGVGIIVSLLLVATVLQLFSDFGISVSIIKLVSELKGKRADIALKVISAIIFKFFVIICFSCLLFIFSDSVSVFLFGSLSYSLLFKLLSIDLIPFAIVPLLKNVLWGLGELKTMSLMGITYVIIRWSAVIFFILIEWDLAGVMVGWIIGDVLFLFLLVFSLIRLSAFRWCSFSEFKSALIPLLRFSWPLFLNNVIRFVYLWYDKVLVFILFALSDLAVYYIVYTAFSAIVSIIDASRRALLPYYGIRYGENNHEAVRTGVKRASRYTMFITFPLMLGLAVLSRPLLSLFAGESYTSGGVVLVVLCLFGLVHGVYAPLRSIFLIYERTGLIILRNLLSVSLSMLLLPFIAGFGLVGLAVVSGVALLLSALLSTYFVKKIINTGIDREVFIKALSSALFMFLVLFGIQQAFYNVYILPIYVALGFFAYMLCIKAFNTLDTEDFRFFKQLFGEKIGRFTERLFIR
jgi:O-antigen/teichoic acid export membrane protein